MFYSSGDITNPHVSQAWAHHKRLARSRAKAASAALFRASERDFISPPTQVVRKPITLVETVGPDRQTLHQSMGYERNPHLMNFLCPQVPLASSIIFSATPVALQEKKREQRTIPTGSRKRREKVSKASSEKRGCQACSVAGRWTVPGYAKA